MPDRKIIWTVLCLAALLVMGVAGSVWMGDRLERTTTEKWLKAAKSDAAHLTDTIQSTISQTESALLAIASHLDGHADLSRSYFNNLRQIVETWDLNIDFESFAFARRILPRDRQAFEDEAGAPLTVVGKPDVRVTSISEHYAVELVSDETGLFRRHTDLSSHPAMNSVVTTASRIIDQAILGPAYQTSGGDQYSMIATEIMVEGHPGVLVVTLNLTDYFKNLASSRIPAGLKLRVVERDNEARAADVLVPLVGALDAPADVVATELIRITRGQAKWNLNWDIMSDYRGGPEIRFATAIRWGGSVLTLLITTLVGFLALQNLRISSLVDSRTAEVVSQTETLQLTLDTIDQGFVMWDGQHRLMAWSKRCEEFWYAPGDLIRRGMPIIQLLRYIAVKGGFGPGDPEALALEKFDVVTGPDAERYEEFEMHDGRQVRVRRYPTPDGGHVSTYTDITEARRAERQLEENRNILRSLASNLPVFVSLKDAEGRFQFVNRVFEEWVGIKSEDIVGKTVFDVYDKDQATEFAARDQYVIDSGKISAREIDLAYPDGEVRRVVSTRFPILNVNEETVGLGTINYDISEINKSREEADRANRAKSEFLSSMSHELRTPLNSILGFGQMLESDPDQPLTGDQTESVFHILKSGHHLLELIDDVLDMAKIESGKVDVVLENLSPGKILEECLTYVTSMAKKRGIEISVADMTSQAPMIRADRTRLKQVVLNLLTNAIKYNSENGTVSLDVTQRPDDMLRISITDSGHGLSEADQAELFKPFSRLGAENSEIEGTGIGLVVSQNLIEIMRGRIGMKSEVGKGSTFWIELPLALNEGPGAVTGEVVGGEAGPVIGDDVAQASEPVAPDPNGTVLYVEDNPANLKLMGKIIERIDGLSMISCYSGEEGVEVAKSETPDLIILDINLPGMSGLETLKVLRNDARTSGIPVMAVSAAATKSDIAEGMKAGFFRYLTKPIEINETVNAISSALGMSTGPG